MNSEDDTLAGGLPHSEIPGSPIARISPGLFAACHVLHRLSVPRHPPDALTLRLIHEHRRVQGQNPLGAKPCSPRQRGAGPRKLAPAKAGGGGPQNTATSHEDTSPDSPDASNNSRPSTIRLGHITNSLFTLQSTPPPPVLNRARERCLCLLRTSRTAACGVASGAPALLARCRQATLCCDRGGGERDRTDDLLLAKQALSQLSYTPVPEDRDQ